MIVRALIINQLSERRKRLHDLLLTLINKDSEFEFIEEDSNDLTSSYSEKDTLKLSRFLSPFRGRLHKSPQTVLNSYQSMTGQKANLQI